MFNDFVKSVFKGENYTYTFEMQNFNVIQTIYLVGLVLLTGVIYVCIPDPLYMYFTILMFFFLFVTLMDANRTGNITKCALFVSILSNVVYLPICFYGFGKLICCVPLYYILGILYTVLLIHGRLGVIVSVCETLFMCVVTVHIGANLPGFYVNEPTYVDFVAIGIAIIIVGVLAVLAIGTKIHQYDQEYENMKQAHLRVIDAYNSKDIFFANTSHEIRTPLNAIVGTVNLLLDEDLDAKARENVYNILNSCNALLSITNELMELSNTEDNNDVSIQNVKYDLSEILIDIINMMSVRLIESEVKLYVDIDKTLPKYLVGDGGKVRQLFINILNNAVKYTKEGKIILKVYGEKISSEKINLCVEVKDTGIGIKSENLDSLFSDYKRDDDDEKRNIEGTGLGLSFCKEIVEKMGGSIRAESEYHVGSTFYFTVPGEICSLEPIARVPSSRRASAIIFDNNDEYSKNLTSVLDSLNISTVTVSDRMAFEEKVMTGRYKYLFISAERYVENKRFIDRKVKDQRVVVISDISKSVQIDRNAYLITRPVHLINAAMAYNNVTSMFSREIIQKGGFTCPEAKILVVDDNITNLDVASSLLKKYEANVVTAISGNECLNYIENNEVDLIFMDYMMPEMNGIDTLYAIRRLNIGYAKKVPVIALTANVISGAKDMFMEAGFCEYISKPIEPNKLEKALKTFVPRNKIIIKA